MEEDDFLIEAAGWARYYERAQEMIQSCLAAKIDDVPSQEIIDNPQAFNQWVAHCEQVCRTRGNY